MMFFDHAMTSSHQLRFQGTARCMVKFRRSEPKSWKRNEFPMTLLTCQLVPQKNLFPNTFAGFFGISKPPVLRSHDSEGMVYFGCDPLPVYSSFRKDSSIFSSTTRFFWPLFFCATVVLGMFPFFLSFQKAKPENQSILANSWIVP